MKKTERELKQLLIPKALPRNTGRKYEGERSEHIRYLHSLFVENEFLPKKEKLTDKQIQAKLLTKYKKLYDLRRKFDRSKMTINMFRKRYNNNTLFASQPRVLMLSFQYDEYGFIVHTGRYQNYFKSFEECYQDCVTLQIADPRFVPEEYIVEIRNRQNQGDPTWLKWSVPNDTEIKAFQRKLGVKEVYNSAHFQVGWTREDTPIVEDESQ